LTVISAISSDNTDSTDYTEDDLIEILEKAVDESVDEMTSYLKVTHRIGKYQDYSKINKIAFEIKPLISKEIDMNISIRLFNENTIKYLEYNGNSAKIESNYLFNHKIWNTLRENDFSYIVTHDKDNSMIKNNIINDKDRAYIIIKLPEELYMKKGDKMAVSLILHPGIERTITVNPIDLPLKSNSIVEI
jgi:archaellin